MLRFFDSGWIYFLRQPNPDISSGFVTDHLFSSSWLFSCRVFSVFVIFKMVPALLNAIFFIDNFDILCGKNTKIIIRKNSFLHF